MTPSLPEAVQFFRSCTPIEYIKRPPQPCVYTLFLRGEIVYVGVTRDIFYRLDQHCASGKTFDGYETMICDTELEARELEFHLVAALSPALNKSLPAAKEFGFASLDVINRMTGLGLRVIKRAVKAGGLLPVAFRDQKFYRIEDVQSLIEMDGVRA